LLIAALALLSTSLNAQTHKVAAPQKVTRAVGVYEWTGDITKPTAARLVPVTLFIDSHLEDAGVYLARPVPFALQTGVVYSVQKAGDPVGTLNLDYAKDIVTRRSTNDDNPIGAWYGYGAFIPPPAEPPPTKLKPSKNLPVIVGSSDPDKPHMSNRDSAGTTASNPPISHTPPTSSTPKVDVDASDDDDRPHMTRRADTDSSTTTSSSTPTPTANDDDPDRPTLRHRDPEAEAKKQKKQKQSDSAVIPIDTSLNDDPNRPTMHRGKPLGNTAAPQLTGVPPDLHQAVAVSDAADTDPHPFARAWESDSERTETLASLQEIARQKIAAYIATNRLKLTDPTSVDPAPAPAPTPRAGQHRPPAKPVPPPPAPPLTLANEQLSGYQLTYGGLPTFVYTAETPLFEGGPVYLTLITQRLPSGELQVSLASVTDANHLDRTPWLRPVDAVDPDAGHRASLLFELRAQSSRQFALYRLVSAQAEQTFVTGVIE
jgi:hypothetical protein